MRRLPAIALILLLLTGCARSGTAPSSRHKIKIDDVRLETEDGLVLRARLYGAGETAVILAHMYPANQNSWSGFARELAETGNYCVLTFNFRGYGLSEGRKDIANIDKDMLAALRYMEDRGDKIFLIGASMGGTVVLRVASEHPTAGVASLSAPKTITGLSVGNKLDDITGAKLFIAAEGDGRAAATARSLYNSVTEPRELEIVGGDAHGTDMLDVDKGDVGETLKSWLAKHR